MEPTGGERDDPGAPGGGWPEAPHRREAQISPDRARNGSEWCPEWIGMVPGMDRNGARIASEFSRAVEFGRFRAHDVRSIMAAGTGVPRPQKPGEALILDLPTVATRPLGDYAIGAES